MYHPRHLTSSDQEVTRITSASAPKEVDLSCSSGTSSRWRRRDKTEEFDEMEDDEDDEDEGHDDYDVDDEEEAIPVDDDEQLDDILDNDLSW